MSRFLFALPLFLTSVTFGQIQTRTITLDSGKTVTIAGMAIHSDSKTASIDYRASAFPTTHADARAQADQVFAALRYNLELAGTETIRIRAGTTEEFTYSLQRTGAWMRVDNLAENPKERVATWKVLRPHQKLWLGITEALTAPDAHDYFESSMKGAVVPGGANGAYALTGTVISAEPADAPTTIVLAIRDPHTPDATLKLDTPLSFPVEPGRQVEFEGVATDFASTPFMVIFRVDPQHRLMLSAH